MPSSPESVTSKYGLFILAEGRSNPSPEILEVHEIDIVAVHGLNGDAHRTWTSTDGKGKGALWLRDFLPSFLPSARIMTFGYNSKIINPSGNNIEDDSRELLLRVLLSRRAGGIVSL
ncbi:hypothetical protein BKA61DRAFT_605649 [Leptodontidium sp. MPI-SDFR-AT-0119]|nr:hypothetical protein BKA61DRAFT_605649 [Leptodontidium sp. MPI-SDFR-AT-0119]